MVLHLKGANVISPSSDNLQGPQQGHPLDGGLVG